VTSKGRCTNARALTRYGGPAATSGGELRHPLLFANHDFLLPVHPAHIFPPVSSLGPLAGGRLQNASRSSPETAVNCSSGIRPLLRDHPPRRVQSIADLPLRISKHPLRG
jgi:hypothetical protein